MRTMTVAMLLWVLGACGNANTTPEGGVDASAISDAASDKTIATDTRRRDDGAPAPDASNASPVFLTHGVSSNALTAGETVTFTAVLTDPDGIDDLIGGSLRDTSGSIVYGAFATSGQEGAYSLKLSWDDLHSAEAITFEGEQKRVFISEFFDSVGNRATRETTIRLHCDTRGGAACSGTCTSLDRDRACGACDRVCPVSTTCLEGSCIRSWLVNTQSPKSCTAICGDQGYSCKAVCAKENPSSKGLSGTKVGSEASWALWKSAGACAGAYGYLATCDEVPPSNAYGSDCPQTALDIAQQECCCAVPPQ